MRLEGNWRYQYIPIISELHGSLTSKMVAVNLFPPSPYMPVCHEEVVSIFPPTSMHSPVSRIRGSLKKINFLI